MRLLSLHAVHFFNLLRSSSSIFGPKLSSSIAFHRNGVYSVRLGPSRHTLQASSYSSGAGYDEDDDRNSGGGGGVIRNMSVQQLHGILMGDDSQSFQFIDVREDDEVRMVSLPFQNIHYLPLSASRTWIPKLMSGELLDRTVPTACLCHHGVRSKSMAEFLGNDFYYPISEDNINSHLCCW